MRFLKKRKKLFITSLIAICILLIFLSATYTFNPALVKDSAAFVIMPLQQAANSVISFFQEKIDGIAHIGTVSAERNYYKNLAEQLQEENRILRATNKENEDFAELYKIDRIYAVYPKEGAYVTGEDPGNWYNIFTINKGTNNGFQKNMVVLGDGGLVGKIFEVGKNYSKVMSIIDDTSSVSAKCLRTDDQGLVKGEKYLMLEGRCIMEFIDPSAQIMVGDEIVTSNFSSLYPPGISIGVVEEIQIDSNGTKYAIVAPNTDFKHMEMVLVITELFYTELE